MAYNYFPATYQPNFYSNNPYWQNQQMQMQMPTQQPAQMPGAGQQAQAQQPAIQQSGFVLVQSEQEARAYPVAPGNSITFKDESGPFCYVKTMSFNQLDRPVFERYRLVKEDAPSETREAPTMHEQLAPTKNTTYATKDDLAELWDELDALKEKLKAQAEKKTVKARKVTEETEAADDE